MKSSFFFAPLVMRIVCLTHTRPNQAFLWAQRECGAKKDFLPKKEYVHGKQNCFKFHNILTIKHGRQIRVSPISFADI
jgi:hypothetical protein